jgi:co-chaperonin GroES (HSP10)
VKPSGDRVFVKVDKEVAKTASGLILPTKAQKKPNYGVIVALGETSWSKVGEMGWPFIFKDTSTGTITCSGLHGFYVKTYLKKLSFFSVSKVDPNRTWYLSFDI